MILLALAGFATWVAGGFATVWLVGRFTRWDGDEPGPVLIPVFWPFLVIGAPFIGLVLAARFTFERGRNRRRITENRERMIR